MVFKRQYTPIVRRSLVFLRNFVKFILEIKEHNGKINGEILKTLGLDSNVKISSLDAFYKKEFRKQKYIYSFGRKEMKRLKEPGPKYFSFFDVSDKKTSGASSIEFFESFQSDVARSEELQKK